MESDEVSPEPPSSSLFAVHPFDAKIHPSHCLRYRHPTVNHYTQSVTKIDRPDLQDPLKVANYVSDLYQQLYLSQKVLCPGPYMDTQQDINAKMRAILIDWLIEVHMKFKLVPETLYLTVNIIDRYCSKNPVPRSKLQLVGVTALLIACKDEEIYPPEVRDCVYITDNAYGRQEVLDMEQDILKKLLFHITVPTAFPFLLRFLKIVEAGNLVRMAASYYAERTLQEHDMLRFEPSLISAAAVHLALSNKEVTESEVTGQDMLNPPDAFPEEQGVKDPRILSFYSGYSQAELTECANIIARKVGEEPVTASKRQLIAVKKKYSAEKYLYVSEFYKNPETIAAENKETKIKSEHKQSARGNM